MVPRVIAPQETLTPLELGPYPIFLKGLVDCAQFCQDQEQEHHDGEQEPMS